MSAANVLSTRCIAKRSLVTTGKAFESEELLKDLKKLQETYGTNALALTVCQAYVNKLLKNPRVIRYLDRKHKETLGAMRLLGEERKLSVPEDLRNQAF